MVIAQRLNEARNGIQTQTGASIYTINEAAIGAAPGGDNQLLNQVIMQAPDVAQDSFGQFHVRGEHNGLQYRLNGIILPEGISVFGQSLDPRLISSLTLVTGALPAEYGLRTAGIIDLKTKSGVIDPGGAVSIYGGSHGTVEPSFNYGGSAGRLNYFVSGTFLRNDLGIESPDGSSNPIHDHTKQYHGFGYFEYILDEANRLSAVLSTSSGNFQIPNRAGQTPGLTNADGTPLTVNGQTTYPSAALNENQRELNHFAVFSWQHSQGAFDVQTSATARYSSLTFTPDPLGDVLFTGIAQDAYKQNVAYALQSDAAYKLDEMHTLRGGIFVQSDHSKSLTTSQVIALDPTTGIQTSDVPISVVDNTYKTEWIESLYLQDEWKVIPSLTFNYGLRFDKFTAYTAAHQVSPRFNAVWQALDDTTVHLGYSRYLSPPPVRSRGYRDHLEILEHHRRALRHRGQLAARGTGQLLRPRGAAEDHAAVHGGPRHLLQAIAQLDRRGPVRGAHHFDALQLHLRQTVRRRDHRQLHPGGLQRLFESRLSKRQGQELLVVPVQFLAGRS